MDFDSVDPISQEEEPKRLFGAHRLRRGIYLLPSALTVANLLCGYYAVLATFDGRTADFDNAAIAIGFAYVFDSLDGRVARAMRTESSFGREFDSLADVISFGMAPAFLAYAWGVRALAAGAAQVECEIDGQRWTQNPFPYQGKCLKWLREGRESLSAADRRFVDGILAGTGCEVLFGPAV